MTPEPRPAPDALRASPLPAWVARLRQSRPLHGLALLAILLLGGSVGHQLLIQPARRTLDELAAATLATQRQVEALLQRGAAQAPLREAREALRRRLHDAAAVLPDEAAASRLDDIGAAAVDAGLHHHGLQAPSAWQASDAETSLVSSSRLTATGDFGALLHYIESLAQLPRLVRLRAMEILPNGDAAAPLRLSATLHRYARSPRLTAYLAEHPAAAGAEAASAAAPGPGPVRPASASRHADPFAASTAAAPAEPAATAIQVRDGRLTLSLEDVEVRGLLQRIAEAAGINMLLSAAVDGRVSLHLTEVPWQEALALVLRQQGLGQERVGEVLLIAPHAEMAARAAAAGEARQARAGLEPLRTATLQLNYSVAADIAELIRSAPSGRPGPGPGPGPGPEGLLSARGRVSVDARTNMLVIHDTSAAIEAIRRLVARLDVAVRQVLIESRIAVVNDDFAREIGLRAGLSGQRRRDDRGVAVSGSAQGVEALLDGERPPPSDRYAVMLPATQATGRLAMALLGRDVLIDLELAAMQAEGRGELVSTPRVVTVDRREASIKQGFEVPYVTPGTQSSPPTVSFKEALLNLTVTPAITPDQRIFLRLRLAKDEPDFTRAVQGNPPLNRRELSTEVLVGDGETLVLGGAFESERIDAVGQVPLLGSLPVLGALFRSRSQAERQRELLVFVTPSILAEPVPGTP